MSNNDLYGVKEWPLVCIYTNSSAQSVASGSTTRVKFDTVELDQSGITENFGVGVYTFMVNRTGKLEILFTTNLSITGGSFQGLYLYKNSVLQTISETRAGSSVSMSLNWIYQCTAGDVLHLEAYLNGSSPSLGFSNINNRLVFIYHAN